MRSSYQQLPGVDPENSEKGGWGTCPLAGYIETFYCPENSIKIIQINFREKKPPFGPPLNLPLLLLNVTAPERCLTQGQMKIKTHWLLGKLLQYGIHAGQPTPFLKHFRLLSYLGKCCLLAGHPMSCFTLALGYQIALLLHPMNGVSSKWREIICGKNL